jgi:hypothetical protein
MTKVAYGLKSAEAYPEMGEEFVPSGFKVWGNGNLKFPKEGCS